MEDKMRKLLLTLSLMTFACIGLSSVTYAQEVNQNTNDNMPMQTGKMMDGKMHMQKSMHCAKAKMELYAGMHRLWEDHVIYTRNYIISALADLPDQSAVAARLLKNQDDIGNAIKPYYGDAAGMKLTSLLRDHIIIATEVVKAAKMNDTAALQKASQKWTANADEIAAFLSSANPNWSKEELTNMLHKHLELTTGEVVSRLHKDWNADIGYFDRGETHMLMFADILSRGIVKQFPNKF
jgi:hypothetical protein